MSRLQASLPPFLIPGSGGFLLVWMRLQEHNICIRVSEKDRSKVTGRSKRHLSRDGASCSCHPWHLPASVWADGNRAPLGGGSATHASVSTGFGSLSFVLHSSTSWASMTAPLLPSCIVQHALKKWGGWVSARGGYQNSEMLWSDPAKQWSVFSSISIFALCLSRKGRILS